MGVCNAIALPAQHGQVTAADAKTESRGGPGIDFQTDVPGKTQDLGFADEVEIVAQTGSYLDGERAVSFSHDPCRGLQPVRRQGMPRQRLAAQPQQQQGHEQGNLQREEGRMHTRRQSEYHARDDGAGA